MGRPRLDKVLPKYASAYADRHGKKRIRLRRTGWKTIYVHAKPGSAAFTQAYLSWEKGGKVVPGEANTKPGSFDALIASYYRSPEWENIKPTTRNTYRGELERFRAKYGDRMVASMTARNISNLLYAMKETPSAANNLKKRLSQLFDHGILMGLRTDNPTKAVKSLKVKGGGFKTWQEPVIALYEACHPIGTKARLALDLALYTAQRRSDIAIMGPQDIVGGKIKVKQLKTGRELLIPVHPELAKSIAATEIGETAFIVSMKGKPYTKESFGSWFAERCQIAGIEGFRLHGLRKSASRRMAELGLSNQLIKSITGHTTDSEVSRYTKDAEQEKMAEQAMDILANRLKVAKPAPLKA